MKTFLTFISLILSISLFAQKGIVFQEDFSSEEFPPTGWALDGHAENWSLKTTSNAGGTAPEVRFYYSPSFDSTSRFVSPVLDISTYTHLRIGFKHMLDNYSSGYEVGLATTTDNGTTWNTIWTRGGEDITEEIDINITEGLGSSTFQFCFFFSGNSYNLDNWYLDDILVYSPEQVDLQANSINLPSYMAADNIYISSTVTNFGIDEITSLDAHYTINDVAVISESFSDLSVLTGESLDINFSGFYPLYAGDNTVKVWFDNINGNGNDNDQSNDTVSKVIHVATQTTTNFPLYEEFTSSTCSPCASFNSSTFTPFLTAHEGELAIIKYQMSWPNPGDPYYTEEGGVRRLFYGVNAVPQLFAGGAGCSTTSTAVNSAFTNLSAKETFMALNATHQVDEQNNTISVVANVTPFFNGSDFVLHAVVCEKKTTENVATNGETEFHHVMMKMLPNAEGTPLNLQSETTQSIVFEDIDLSGTFVEEMSDLEVVVFIQNINSKEIFQSANSAAGTISSNTVTFNVSSLGAPVEGVEIITNNQTIITDLSGQATISINDGTYSYTTSAVDYIEATGSYTVAGEDISVDIELEAVGINEISSVVRVYPIPAMNSVIVEGISTSINIYNLSGMLVKNIPANGNKTIVDISNLAAGTYFVRSSDNTNVGVQKLIIVK